MERDAIVKQVQDALTFVGQAQELAPHLSELWKELGRLYDELDTVQSAIQCNEYSDEGTLVG